MPNRLSIETVRVFAKAKSGKCLSDTYINAKTKLEWQCRLKHRWFATFDSVKHGSWCPECNSGHRWTIEEIQKIAQNKGGACLSLNFRGVERSLEFRCSKNHEWSARAMNIIRGTWCPNCSGKNRTIEDIRKIAKERGGKCLSKQYHGGETPLFWQCRSGHKWRSKPTLVFAGHWCPVCGGSKKLTIMDMQSLAKSRGGKSLSLKYINSGTKLLWECAKGDQWWASPENVKLNGSWCPYCAGTPPLDIEDARKLAAEHQGQCISHKYKNGSAKLLWKCSFGHIFSASYEAVKGSPSKKAIWCRKCAGGNSEEIVRQAVELLTNEEFPRVRPEWIKNIEGRKLELDGYCEKLQVAFEHQGHHHNGVSKTYGNSKRDFARILQHDKIKKAACKTRRVTLIEVPQLFVELRLNKLLPFLKTKLKKAGVHIKQSDLTEKDVLIGVGQGKLAQLKEIAIERGGQCLSNKYVNARAPMHWRCNANHEWRAEAYRVEKGSWCRVCAGKAKLTIERMQVEAKKRGGQCISKIYKGKDQPLNWECRAGKHKWVMTWNNVRHGQWCPECAHHNRKVKSAA